MRKKHANPKDPETPGSETPEAEGPGGEPAVPPGAASTARPSQEEIARRAHGIYLARGGREGHEIENWLEAERELTQKE